MADEGYNPMQKTLENLQKENQHLKRDVQEAERINHSHKIANGKVISLDEYRKVMSLE